MGKIVKAATCICALMLISGCALFPTEEPVIAPPIIEPKPITYVTKEVTLSDIVKSTKIGGTIVSSVRYNLSFEARSGYLKELYIKSGDVVTKGQKLMELDTDGLLVSIQKQELILKKAQIQYDAVRYNSGVENQRQASLLEIDRDLARLDLNNMRNELAKAIIEAPCDGEITYKASVMPGDFVTARSIMLTISDPTKLYLKITGDKYADFEYGAEVIVTAGKESYTGKVVATPFSGKESENAFAGEEKTVYIDIEGLPESVKIGASASAEVILEKREGVIVLPRNVVQTYSGQNVVSVLENGVKVEKIVELGVQGNIDVEIVKGLEVGELVIIS